MPADVRRVGICSVRSDLGDPVPLWFPNLCVSVSPRLGGSTREHDRSVILSFVRYDNA
jgi:hypothetical protein